MNVSQKDILELSESIELMAKNVQTIEYDSFRQIAERVNFSEGMVIIFLGCSF